ncbi:MAG: BatD family protein [Candidatus Marinimicrobia bacterium]|nr:BatD family protein [Candidatus Neomarinimicrobiota bacterium]MCF7839149.1 BatD family protein [Candidatus Neomarinimicrobiota bacterium]MCF7902432.1 BatD family protein [Candidatus Neomarinimicrobiota bacterium]
MGNRLIFGLILVGMIPGLLMGQPDIHASVDARRIYVGDTFTYKVEVKNSDSTPTIHLPASRKLSVVSGPMQSTSFSIMNGVQSSTRSVSYTMVALEPGELTIPPSEVVIRNKRYQSNAVQLEVLPQPGSGTKAAPGGSRNDRQLQQTQPQSKSVPAPEIMLRAEPNRTDIVVGEPVTITYKLYTQVRVYNYGIDKLPDAVGFWSEEIPLTGQPQLKAEIVDGVNYQSAVLKKVVYYPTRPGELTIEPLRVNLEVQSKRRRSRNTFFSDPFFDDVFSHEKKVLFSNSLKLKVSDVPRPTPPNYSGAVGKFRLSARLDTNTIHVNDAVGLHVTLEGTGNFKTLNLPDITLPDGIDMFKPEKEEKVRLVNEVYQGYKRMTYLLVPRAAGEMVIPAFTLVYYDSDAKKYRTAETKRLTLQVKPLSGEQPLITSGYSREEVALMNQDLRFIKLQGAKFVPMGYRVLNQWWYHTTMMMGLVAMLGVVLYTRRQEKIGSDKALGRRLRAHNRAQTLLKSARKVVMDEKQVYALLSQAVVGYIGDRLNLPEKALDTDALIHELTQRKISEQLVSEVRALLIRLDMGRFAPGADSAEPPELIQNARQILTRLSRELKE